MKFHYEVWYWSKNLIGDFLRYEYKDDIFDDLDAARMYILARQIQHPNRGYRVREVRTRDLPDV